MTKKYYQNLFLVSALWNWLISISFFFFHEEIFQFFQMVPLNYPVTIRLFMSLVFIFGIGYYWAAKEPQKNISIVKLGAVGKITIFLILFHYGVVLQDIPLIFITPGIVDALFAILFLKFLKYEKRATHDNNKDS